MFPKRAPAVLRSVLKGTTWSLANERERVFITFDDGPIPGVTPWVLDTLQAYGAKATFFCIGRNAKANPDILERITAEGHGVGNHTWDHMRGWGTRAFTYARQALRTDAVLPKDGPRLFRPPYGRITPRQARMLATRYHIVMWDVLSADFDPGRTGEACTRTVIRNTRPGSIIVFHDSLKAEPRLRHALPLVLDHLKRTGLRCASLQDPSISFGSR